MTHARTLALPPAADPIHAAIERHRAAYDAFQIAPEGPENVAASDDYDAASTALAVTPCATRFGALALLDHLRWWLGAEAAFKAAYQPAYGIAETRAADLTLFFGTNLPPIAIPRAALSGRLAGPVSTRALPAIDLQRRDTVAALPDEPLPGEVEPWEAVAPIRPDTAFVRGRRFIDVAGELLTACILIGAGAYLTGLASLH